MNKMTDIQRRVDEAMDSILDIGQATPQPFFYTRLMARIQSQENGWEKISKLISRPAVAFITVSMVLMLNIYVAFNETATLPTGSPEISEVATADDLGTNTFYDIENVQP
jgi:hypothetical protein